MINTSGGKMSYQPYYIKLGLCNIDSVDIGEYSSQLSKKNLGLYCTSDKCCSTMYLTKSGHQRWKRASMIFKTQFPIEDQRCPDCHSTMIWRQLNANNRAHVAEKKTNDAMKRGPK